MTEKGLIGEDEEEEGVRRGEEVVEEEERTPASETLVLLLLLPGLPAPRSLLLASGSSFSRPRRKVDAGTAVSEKAGAPKAPPSCPPELSPPQR